MAAEDKKISDLTVVASTGGAEFTEVVKGSGNFRRKNNMTASASPTATDDSAADYSIGSLWHYDGSVWVCKDNAAGAAVWVRMGAIESSSLDVTIDGGVATVNSIGDLFTPDVSNETGTIAITGGFYSRSGQVVTMSFQFDAESAAGTSDITFDFTLPVASEFTNSRQLFGSNSSNPDLASCVFRSNGDKGSIEINTQDVDQTIQTISVIVQYFIP